MTLTTSPAQGFGVYIHWPFCLSKCPYCDFNSHVRHGGIDEARFVQAFLREMETMAKRTPGREVTTIFFGGGTPSLMKPATVSAILDGIAKYWKVAPDVEVTLEANPTSVEAERFRGFRSAGVNRVSLGVQALDDASLKELGRLHSAEEALKAVGIARSVFDRYSFDLIYARPGQTPRGVGARTQARDRAKPPSICRSISSPSRPTRRSSRCMRAASWSRPTKRLRASSTTPRRKSATSRASPPTRFPITRERARNAGTISSIGAATIMSASVRARMAASSRTARRVATATEKRPESWLMRVESLGHGLIVDEALTREERADEYLLMGLRLAEGISPQRFEEISGRPLDAGRIAILRAEGAVETTAERPSARDASRVSDPRCGGRRSGGLKSPTRR